MEKSEKYSKYIDLFKQARLGILSVDIGSLEDENSEWRQDDGFCIKQAKGIHQAISHLYKKVVGQEPVNYLFEHFNNHPDAIFRDYYAYSFPVNTNSFGTNGVISVEQDEFELEEDPREDTGKIVRNSNFLEIIERQFFQSLNSEVFQNKRPEEKFQESQAAFTNAISYAYYRVLGKHYLNYATIVLLTYKRDNCSIFSHSAVLFSNKPLTEPNAEDNTEIITSPLLQLIFENIRGDRYLSIIGGLSAELREKSEQSAKAAIMSRNMSHNLGSHVMAYLKQKLSSVSSILKAENKVLSDLYSYQNNCISKEPKDKVEMPFLVGLGRFIGYLQERQDYIATIATDYIPYGAPVNFKDAVYDELNPDLRHIRHNSSDSEKDQNKPFNVLLSYIAKSEGLSRENMDVEGDISTMKTKHDILFGYIKYDSELNEPHIFGVEPENCTSFDSALEEMRKINFSLPGGLVGRQALFSVIENLIRNAAKHGDTNQVDNLVFLFDIIDGSKLITGDVIKLSERICDSRYRELYSQAHDIKDLYLLTITDNLIYNERVIEALRCGLKEQYIDDKTLQMTTGNKGIKEIRISSSWLRSEVNEDLYLKFDEIPENTDNKKAPLVAVELTADHHLRYIIALHKNKKFAFIAEGLSDGYIRCFKTLQAGSPNDWYGFKNTEDFKTELQTSKTSFGYIIVANQKIYNTIRPLSSNRIFIWEPSKKQQAIIDQPWNKCLTEGKYAESVLINKMLKDKESYYQLKTGIESLVYHLFCNNSATSPSIFIWDKKTYTAQIEAHKVVFDKIKVYSSEVNDAIAKFAYRTHHSTEADFRTFYKDKIDGNKYCHIQAVDAITGDNSSDRLVRRENLDEEWYCSHLRALQKRVAVFDERIFKIVHNVDERTFIEGDEQIVGIIEKLQKKQLSSQAVFSMIENGEVSLNLSQMMRLEDIKAKGEINTQILCDLLSESSIRFCERSSIGNHQSAFYSGKNIDIFTIIKEKAGEFAIVGCTEDTWREENYNCVFSKIGRIHLKGEVINVELLKDGYYKAYDYITIHQGLLDKIYEGFGIKETHSPSSDDEDYINRLKATMDKKKCQFTTSLYNQFMHENEGSDNKHEEEKGEKILINDSEYFLPRFIIHSGRAKPAANDMPQKLPFVQFAAIENAVKDSKYSLVQLLDYARFED